MVFFYIRSIDWGWCCAAIGSSIGHRAARMLCNYASRGKEDLLEKAEETYDKGVEVVKDAGLSAMEFAQQGQETVQEAGRSAKEFAKRTQMAREPGRSAL